MSLNEIYSEYTPSSGGRKSFPLQHNGDPIFYKIFNAEDSNIVNLNKNIISIPNHFFKTGETLIYDFGTGSPVGIDTNSPGASGIITAFPSTIYPIVVNKDTIRIALGSSLALNNEYVDINSLGIGTNHSLKAIKQNSKCLISINNIIQSPISVGSSVQVSAYTADSITVTDLKNIKLGVCLRINEELVKVSAINYDTKELILSRGENVLGTNLVPFNSSLIGSYIDILSGSYNIIKDVIYFDEAPLDSGSLSYNVLETNIIFENSSFTLLTDKLNTGDLVFLTWPNPPKDIPNQTYYYIIKNTSNNFSFAKNYLDSVNGNKVVLNNFSNNEFAISDFLITYYYPIQENPFNGRVFLKSNYDGNVVFDDISNQFTGIASSFELKNSGISTVGISSDNGILLVNDVFQYPGFGEEFNYAEIGGTQTNVIFSGSVVAGLTSSKGYDVNVRGLPRGGIIVSYGTTSGINYQPLTSYSNLPLTGSSAGIGASVSFSVGPDGTIKDFKFTNFGYNYKVGEILVPVGTSGVGTQINDDKIHIKINETNKDAFSAWNVGILENLDDLSDKINGTRKTFTLLKNGQRISLDADSQYEIDLQENLLVFINDILQIPGVSYTFNSGSKITFTEAIPTGSSLKLYFYKGYYNDTYIASNIAKLKEGDSLQLHQDIFNPPPVQENPRIIKELINSDTLRTEVYSDIGLSKNSSQLRSVTWTPQKQDLIIDGTYVSKGRYEQLSGITSFTKVVDYLGTFNGISTSIIGLNTTGILIGDYVEGDYVGTGVTVVSIGVGYVGIGSTDYSTSPDGINTATLSFYRKS